MKILEVTQIPDADTCTIYSIAHVTGNSPEAVWQIAEPLWRRRFGMHSGQISAVLRALGFDFGRFRHDLIYRPRSSPAEPYRHWSLGQLLGMLDHNPSAVPLLIGTRGHSIGYRDGKILDVANTGDRSRIESVYEIQPAAVVESLMQPQFASDPRFETIRQKAQQGLRVWRGVRPDGPADPGDFGTGTYYSTSHSRSNAHSGGQNLRQYDIRFSNPIVLAVHDAYDLADRYGTVRGLNRQAAAMQLNRDLRAAGFDGLISVNIRGVNVYPHRATHTELELVDLRLTESVIREVTRQRLYHGSGRYFENGFVLTPQLDGYTNWPEVQHTESLVERYRPANALSRSQSVFMIAAKNLDRIQRMGGGYDYLYLVEPIGRVERNDLSWYSEIERYFWDDPNDPEARQFAENYWSGVRSPKPQWEYRAQSARIVQLVQGEKPEWLP